MRVKCLPQEQMQEQLLGFKPRRTARLPCHVEITCFLLMNFHQFQGQSYAKEIALIGQITVELAFILGKLP